METLERQRESALGQRSGPPSGNPGGADLGAVRQDVDRLHRAGANVIDQALSVDSQDFNDAVRQQTGQ